jgi:hypothetical protein
MCLPFARTHVFSALSRLSNHKQKVEQIDGHVNRGRSSLVAESGTLIGPVCCINLPTCILVAKWKAGCCAGEQDIGNLQSYIVSMPWQLRCHMLRATQQLLCTLSQQDPGSLQFNAHTLVDEVHMSGATEEHRILVHRELALASLRDPSSRVKLAAAHHLDKLLRCAHCHLLIWRL